VSVTRRSLFVSGFGALCWAGLARCRIAPAQAAGGARNLVVVVADGGWDPVYCLDPKPGSQQIAVPATGSLGRYDDLDVWVDGPAVDEFFTRHASRTAIVRGIDAGSFGHAECKKRMLTGTRSELNPDLGAIAGHELGRDLAIPYFIVGNVAFTGALAGSSARVGAKKQLRDLLEDRPDADLIETYANRQADRLREVRAATGFNRTRVDDYTSARQRASTLTASQGLFAGGGRFDFGKQIEIASSALASGLCRSATISTGYNWDTHETNEDQRDGFEQLFAGLVQLAGAIDLETTTVAVISEMGRHPQLNDAQGKNHWPVTSALVFGAGVRPGVHGGTGPGLEALRVDLASGALDDAGSTLTYGSFAAGILALVGVEPSAYLETEVFRGFVA